MRHKGVWLGLMCGVAVAISCKDDDKASYEELIEPALDQIEFVCQCFVERGSYLSIEECLEDQGVPEYDDSIYDCANGVLDEYPIARIILECQADALSEFVSCLRARGCEQLDPDTFICDDGTQIPDSFVCNGSPDCLNGEDEQQNCPGPFMCNDGTPIPPQWVCDGAPDCIGGEDEQQNCPGPFMCPGGGQIPPQFVCDFDEDCPGGEDEDGCPETCESAFNEAYDRCGYTPGAFDEDVFDCLPTFMCADGFEIPLDFVCDGFPECPDGSDELNCP